MTNWPPIWTPILHLIPFVIWISHFVPSLGNFTDYYLKQQFPVQLPHWGLREKIPKSRHIWRERKELKVARFRQWMSSSRSSKLRRNPKYFYHCCSVWPLAKFGSFLLCGWSPVHLLQKNTGYNDAYKC
jgi:hypothetical protein